MRGKIGVDGEGLQVIGRNRTPVKIVEDLIRCGSVDLRLTTLSLGMRYFATGEPGKAVEQLRKALELAADNRELQAKIKAAQEKVAL
jgi:hypothetical protein